MIENEDELDKLFKEGFKIYWEAFVRVRDNDIIDRDDEAVINSWNNYMATRLLTATKNFALDILQTRVSILLLGEKKL